MYITFWMKNVELVIIVLFYVTSILHDVIPFKILNNVTLNMLEIFWLTPSQICYITLV